MAEQVVSTLEKIKTLDDLRGTLEHGAWTIAAGGFDPLTAEAAGRLENSASPGRKLLVVVRSDANELLDANSRAVLVAALRCVDAVMVEHSSEWRTIAGRNPAVRVNDDPAADTRRRSEFEQLVLTRQRHGSGG